MVLSSSRFFPCRFPGRVQRVPGAGGFPRGDRGVVGATGEARESVCEAARLQHEGGAAKYHAALHC